MLRLLKLFLLLIIINTKLIIINTKRRIQRFYMSDVEGQIGHMSTAKYIYWQQTIKTSMYRVMTCYEDD